LDIEETEIRGVWITRSTVFRDERGLFRELSKFSVAENSTGEKFKVAQTNASKSKLGALRGMHFSLNPEGQWKWITCLAGSVYDVVVDVRERSETFSKKIQIELSEENELGVLIQGNLAHGFQALKANSIVTYNLSSEYNPSMEFELNPLDPALGISWPINEMLIARKDLNAPNLETLRTSGKLPPM